MRKEIGAVLPRKSEEATSLSYASSTRGLPD